MTMIEFLNRLFGRHTSGATAKERLRLVLMSDHLSLAPDMIDAMKRDLVDVIARYVEVDREKVDVHFEHQDKALAMLANIPITGVTRNGNGTNGNGTSHGEVPAGHGEVSISHPEVSKDPEESKGSLSHPEPVEGQPSAVEATSPNPPHNGHRPRRKRRKNGGSSGAPAPAT